jgi:hypothetical protein
MGIWVLDTETKGTGAEMVPIEKLQERKRSSRSVRSTSVIRRNDPTTEAPAAAPQPVEAPGPRRFRVTSVLSGRLLAEDAGARDVIEAMRSSRSVADLRVDVWDHRADEWRPLTLRERNALWDFR